MDSEFAQALTNAGVMSVKDLLLLDGEMFAQLTFMAGPDEKKLKFLDVAKHWDEYCVSPAALLMGRAPTPTTMVSTTAPTMKSASPTTLHDNFAKSIKKDPEAYPAFKEAQFWDTWNRELTARRICTI